MKCPGQDWRYWTGDVLFEVPCPECGYAVEFFKDEPRGRCPNCGHRFLNPGIDIGCAQWCGLSEQCLGLVPEPGLAGRGKEQALASRLIQAVREECQAQPARFAAALSVFRYAKWLVSREGGDPQVVLAAALLLEISHPARRHGKRAAGPRPRQSARNPPAVECGRGSGRSGLPDCRLLPNRRRHRRAGVANRSRCLGPCSTF